MQEKEINDLPMNWYKFWKYFRFPVGIILSICNFSSILSQISLEIIVVNENFIIALLLDALIIAFTIITYLSFCFRNKKSYQIFMHYLFIIDFVMLCIVSTLNTVRILKFFRKYNNMHFNNCNMGLNMDIAKLHIL